MRGHTISWLVQRLRSPLINKMRDGLRRFFDLLVHIRGLWPRNRHVPVYVRVGESEHEPARPALSTRLSPGLLTPGQLCQPECHSLLSDSDGTRYKQYLWQLATPDRLGQPVPGCNVADQRVRRYGWQAAYLS
jgi:hypothetical protein